MTKWENYLQHLKDKRLIYFIYKEHLQINKFSIKKYRQKYEGKICYTISNVLKKPYAKPIRRAQKRDFWESLTTKISLIKSDMANFCKVKTGIVRSFLKDSLDGINLRSWNST